MKSIKTKPVVKQIATEFDLTQEKVYDIIASPFELQAIVMKKHFKPEKNQLPMLRIPNFGIFAIPTSHQNYLKERYGFTSDEG